MNNTDEHRLNSLTERIIGCAFKVANTLGHGFLEKVYENAMCVELKKTGLAFERQKHLKVSYEAVLVGEYIADLIVEDVLVEIKAMKHIEDTHVGQCVNYLKATGLRLSLLINFGSPRVQIRRVIGPDPCSSVSICV